MGAGLPWGRTFDRTNINLLFHKTCRMYHTTTRWNTTSGTYTTNTTLLLSLLRNICCCIVSVCDAGTRLRPCYSRRLLLVPTLPPRHLSPLNDLRLVALGVRRKLP